jgi:hypothetical protein
MGQAAGKGEYGTLPFAPGRRIFGRERPFLAILIDVESTELQIARIISDP